MCRREVAPVAVRTQASTAKRILRRHQRSEDYEWRVRRPACTAREELVKYISCDYMGLCVEARIVKVSVKTLQYYQSKPVEDVSDSIIRP